MELIISGGDKAIADFAERLSPARLGMALSVAVNDTVRQVRREAGKEIAAHSSIKRRKVEENIRMRYAAPGALEGRVIASGRPLPLRDFNPSATRSGVTVKVWGKTQRYKGAFLVSKYGGNVYVRESASRLPIHKMFGAGIAQVMRQHETDHILLGYGRSRLEINVRRQLDRYSAGSGGVNR
jgi:hypothetical protein